jgi:hypothetical protein
VGVFAHQGGWDEILLILGPMVVVVLLLRLAKRRVDRNLAPAQPPSVDRRHPPTGPNPPDH